MTTQPSDPLAADRENERREEIAREWADALEVETTLSAAAIVAGCYALHDCQGTGEPDSLIHRPSQKSWEEPTLPRWAQWVETVCEVHRAITTVLALPPLPQQGEVVAWRPMNDPYWTELAREVHRQANGPSAWTALTDAGRQYYADRIYRAHTDAAQRLAYAAPPASQALGDDHG